MTVHASLQVIGSITGAPNAPAPLVVDAEIQRPATNPMYEPGMYEAGMYQEEDYSQMPVISGTLDTSYIANMLPRDPGRVQIVGRPVIMIDGTEVPPHKIIGGIAITERIDGARTFSFALAGFSSVGTDDTGSPTFANNAFEDPFGLTWVESWTGAPPGKQEIDISWQVPRYSISKDGANDQGGFVEIPVIQKGIIENAERSHTNDGDIWQLNGVGREQRADRQKIELVVPPGSGLSPGELIRKILELLPELENENIPDFDVNDSPCHIDSRRDAEIIIKDQSGWQVANEILSLWNYRLYFSRGDDIRIRYLGRDDERSADWNLTIEDVTSDGIVFSPANDGPTRIRVTGSSQITSDNGGGLRTETQEVEIKQIYARRAALEKISDTAGATTASGFEDYDPFLRTVSLTKFDREYDGDTLISERVRVWAWFMRERSVGTMSASDGSITYNVNTPIFAGAIGSTQWVENWELVSDETTTYVYTPQTVDGDIVQVLTSKERIRKGWRFRRRRVATITTGGALDWESTVMSWQGEGMVETPELWAPVEEELTTYQITPDLFITSEQVEFTTWFVVPGNAYYFATGETSSYVSEQYQVVEVRTTTYSPQGDSAALRTETVQDHTGKTVAVKTETIQSYLPAARIKETIRPNTAIYPKAQFAARNKSEGFEVLYISEALEENRQAYEEQLSSPWLESAEEALCFAQHIVQERSAIPVTFELPLNLLIRPGQKINLSLGSRRFDDHLSDDGTRLFSLGAYEVYVTEATHSYGDGLARTSIIGKVYVT